ncbi:MAG TPA: methionine adenosyltransferase [Polyangiales bacterium]|nr:methionine adenosyltransferase [Polyangiales bacterium]
MTRNFLFTSESVTDGHPDKLCDQISDAIVDRYLQQDPMSSVVAETAVSKGIVFIAVHFASKGSVDIPGLAREVIRDIGYDDESFNARSCSVMTSLNEVPSIDDLRIDERELDDEGIEALTATEHATVFGFACNQTEQLLPLPIVLAHDLARQLSEVRRDGSVSYLNPDGKTQVGIEYRDNRPHRIHSITLVASQKKDAPALGTLRDDLREKVIEPVFASREIRPDPKTSISINPEGAIVLGGPRLHSGSTGRKTGVDTWGDYARSSGSALSGKDPTRIDRIGVYAARHAAKNVIAAGLADECEVQLSYSIGLPGPVTVRARTFGTGRVPNEEISKRIEDTFDLRLGGILRDFELRWLPMQRKQDFYRRLACYGQVGRPELDLPWERTDAVAKLG